jgi:formylglycine-generating enzyme required for sulfatase activity
MMKHRAIASLPLLFAAAGLLAQTDSRRVAPFAGRRLALVIGNQAYSWFPLVNPINDARAVARTLLDVGFAAGDIRLVLDARQSDLRRAAREFAESVKPGDLALVYYSGHGVEVKGGNYLLPVDLPRDATEGYVEDEAVSAQRLLRDLDEHGARVRVLILDACRDNPLRAARSIGGGLAPMEGRGSLIVFATEAGRTAGDNPGGSNGVFTQYLLEGLRQPGVSLDDAMKHVSRNVARATGEKQVPAIYGLLLEDVILLPAAAPAPAPVAAPSVVQPVPAAPPVVERAPQPGQLKVNPADAQLYAWIPPGRFRLGCSLGDGECFDNEKPAHDVQIAKGFWLGRTSVTVGAWKRYRAATGKPALPAVDAMGRKINEAGGDDNLPAVSMTWYEARGFCEWSGGRLPTEAEWEYAARAGSTASRYGSLDAIAWYGDNSGRLRVDSAQIWREDQANYVKRLYDNGHALHLVGQKQPNAWNLYDTLGNVWQWTADWYDGKYYDRRDMQDPPGPPSGQSRVIRGGAWNYYPRVIRVSFRGRYAPEQHEDNIGLRCMAP